MPVHDWTRVSAGTFHHFHLYWIAQLGEAIKPLLPPPFYVQAESVADLAEPDSSEADIYASWQRSLVIRHSREDQIIAMVEIVSPGNKNSRRAILAFRDKAVEALQRGFHLLIIDLHPPTPRDPQGIHGLIWGEINRTPYEAPAGKPLTLAAYVGGLVKEGYVRPIAVRDTLPDMPLFLVPEEYLDVPLEGPYMKAFADVPDHLQRQLQQ